MVNSGIAPQRGKGKGRTDSKKDRFKKEKKKY